MYGRDLVTPGPESDQPVFDIDDPQAMEQFLNVRAAKLQSILPSIYDRLATKQHKDAVRYRQRRQRDLPPRVHRFNQWDFVYIRRRKLNTHAQDHLTHSRDFSYWGTHSRGCRW
eukprot:scaffold622278_cov27-Prasinocladus_malaysianus.AAC.1